MPAAIANREEVAQAIVNRMAGGEFLTDICAEEGMPSRQTFWEWVRSDADLATQCARARALAAGEDERKVAKIRDDVLAGNVEPDAARVAINATTWLAKVRNPKVYGDKVEIEGSLGPAVPVLNMLFMGAPPSGAGVIEVQAKRIEGGQDGSSDG